MAIAAALAARARGREIAPEAIGRPYVVFAGNVGDEETLGQVVAILNGEQEDG